jgi:hypothetical protein
MASRKPLFWRDNIPPHPADTYFRPPLNFLLGSTSNKPLKLSIPLRNKQFTRNMGIEGALNAADNEFFRKTFVPIRKEACHDFLRKALVDSRFQL